MRPSRSTAPSSGVTSATAASALLDLVEAPHELGAHARQGVQVVERPRRNWGDCNGQC